MMSTLPNAIAPAGDNFWKILEKAVKNVRRNAAVFRTANSSSQIRKIDEAGAAAFTGNYLISTDRGVYAIQQGSMFQLLGLDTYGMAVRDGRLFLALNSDEYSAICTCVLPETLAHGAILDFKELCRLPVNKSGRVHQMTFYSDHLVLAHTASNAITFVDAVNGRVVSECHPFRDAFGNPIKGDHNHINSVSECGDCLLFCAYKAGTNAMIGVIEGDKIDGFAVPNMGAHDVHVTGRTLYYSDTFGATYGDGSSECGYLMANGRPVDEEFFGIGPGFAIRGCSQQGSELVVGHSHKGSRAKRFEGHGSLFRLIDHKVVHALETPFSQIYDVLGMDGRHFETPPGVATWNEVTGFISSILGEPIYSTRLDRPPTEKRRWERRDRELERAA